MLHHLVAQIEECLQGRSSTTDLEGWLVSNLQRILDSGDAEAVRLANELDADLMAAGDAALEENEFWRRLDSYVRRAQTIQRTEQISSDAILHTLVETEAVNITFGTTRDIDSSMITHHLAAVA